MRARRWPPLLLALGLLALGLLALGLLALGLLAPAASAHEAVAHGGVTVKVGWLDEPPIQGQSNGVVLAISDASGNPVDNVTTLRATIQYGPASGSLALDPSDETPGLYLATVIPSQEGKYYVQLGGAVNGTTFPDRVAMQDVQPASDVTFPPASGPDLDALAANVTALQQQVGMLQQQVNALSARAAPPAQQGAAAKAPGFEPLAAPAALGAAVLAVAAARRRGP